MRVKKVNILLKQHFKVYPRKAPSMEEGCEISFKFNKWSLSKA